MTTTPSDFFNALFKATTDANSTLYSEGSAEGAAAPPGVRDCNDNQILLLLFLLTLLLCLTISTNQYLCHDQRFWSTD